MKPALVPAVEPRTVRVTGVKLEPQDPSPSKPSTTMPWAQRALADPVGVGVKVGVRLGVAVEVRLAVLLGVTLGLADTVELKVQLGVPVAEGVPL